MFFFKQGGTRVMKNLLTVIRNEDLPYCSYILYTICYLIVLSIWGMGASISKIRYYVLFLAIIAICINMFIRKKKILDGKELLLVIPLGILFFIVSVIRALEAKHALAFRTLVQISLVVLPALYVLFLLNLVKLSSLIKLMRFTLFCTIIIYFCEPGHTLIDFFNYKNYLNISILHSNSFTESSICSEIFLELFIFFNFYKLAVGKNIDQKSNKRCYWISLIFTILCFKRLAMLFVFCVLILNQIVDWKIKLPKNTAPLMAIFFTIATILYAELIKGNLFPGFDVYKFTTGRDYILSLWAQHNYLSFGYGSSMILIGRYLEMDLVQIYMELNLIALFAFTFVFFKIAGKNIYSVLTMLYAFFNMLTASSLPGSLSWVILLITVVSISSSKLDREQIHISKQELKIKDFIRNKMKGIA